MSELKLEIITVVVDGYGEFEIREPLYDDIQVLFTSEGDKKSFGIDLMKKCIYKDGEPVWSKPVGAKLGMKLMALAPKVMEVVGMSDEGKLSPAES